VLYERIFVSALPRIMGQLGIRFYRRIYANFSFGARPRCWGSPRVVMGRDSSITIGDDVWMVSDPRRANIALSTPCKLRTMDGAAISVGDRVALNGTSITSRARVEIGSGTMIAANVVIVDADFHQHWPPDERNVGPGSDKDAPVVIGRNVWISMGSLILKGVTIGDNSIIGAGSVVTRSIPPNVLAAGVPARVIRSLGDDGTEA
jgi:acetyltransferase-like isoleucine patch superfamily enzyme